MAIAVSVAAAILLPLFMRNPNLPIVIIRDYTTSAGYLRIFTTFASAIILVVGFIEFRKRRRDGFPGVIPILVFLLFSLILLYQLNIYQERSFDYNCYEGAARAVVNGTNPYARSPFPYLYPPLIAQLMAGGYKAVAHFMTPDQLGETGNSAWDIVFYLYTCIQFLFIILAYFLCTRLARMAGMDDVGASLLCGVALAFNTPLIMSLKLQQVNVFLLVFILLAILYQHRHPTLSAVAAAIGGHIKLYGLILLLPWLLMRRIAVVITLIAAFLVIVLIQVDFGRNWSPWEQYFAYIGSLSTYYFPLASGLHSLLYYILKILYTILNISEASFDHVFGVTAPIISISFLGWYIYRFIKRERLLAGIIRDASAEYAIKPAIYRMMSHSVDAILFALLISSTTWHHHFLLAVPAFLWAFGTSRGDRRWLVGICGFLIFCVPPLVVLPIKYLPAAAVIGLAYVCRFDELPVSGRGETFVPK